MTEILASKMLGWVLERFELERNEVDFVWVAHQNFLFIGAERFNVEIN